MTDALDDDVLAVVAHSLLNSLAVIQGNAETLSIHWDRVEAPVRLDLLHRIVLQAELVSGVLTDLVRSGRPELVDALEEMREASH